MKKIILLLLVAWQAYGQATDGPLKTLLTAGTSTAYTITEAMPSSYDEKERFNIRFHIACGSNPTLKRAGLAALPLKFPGNVAIGATELKANTVYMVSYNSNSGGYYQVVGSGAGDGGTWGSISGTLSSQTDLQSALDLKNTIVDNTFLLKDNSDATKILNFQLSGISTGTTRTLTIPNASGTVATQEYTDALTLPAADATHDGYLLQTDWSTFNNKLTSTLANTKIFVGNGSNVATGVSMSGDATMANTGVITVGTGTRTNGFSLQLSSGVPTWLAQSSGGWALTGTSTLTGTTTIDQATNILSFSNSKIGINTATPAFINGIDFGIKLNVKGTVAIDDATYAYQVYNNSGQSADSRVWLTGAESGSYTISPSTDGGSSSSKFNINRSGQVLIGGAINTAAASGIVEIKSTTQGFLPPRMTSTQRDAISSPAEGLMIYNTTTHKLNVYTGSAWETITSL